jgi:hypothetical protein
VRAYQSGGNVPILQRILQQHVRARRPFLALGALRAVSLLDDLPPERDEGRDRILGQRLHALLARHRLFDEGLELKSSIALTKPWRNGQEARAPGHPDRPVCHTEKGRPMDDPRSVGALESGRQKRRRRLLLLWLAGIDLRLTILAVPPLCSDRPIGIAAPEQRWRQRWLRISTAATMSAAMSTSTK